VKVVNTTTTTFATARVLARELLFVELKDKTEHATCSQLTKEYVLRNYKPAQISKETKRLNYNKIQESSLKNLIQQLYNNRKIKYSMLLSIKFNDNDLILCSYHSKDDNNSCFINAYGVKCNMFWSDDNWSDDVLIQNASSLGSTFLHKEMNIEQTALVEKYILHFDISQKDTFNRRKKIRGAYILNGEIQPKNKNKGSRGKNKRKRNSEQKEKLVVVEQTEVDEVENKIITDQYSDAMKKYHSGLSSKVADTGVAHY